MGPLLFFSTLLLEMELGIHHSFENHTTSLYVMIELGGRYFLLRDMQVSDPRFLRDDDAVLRAAMKTQSFVSLSQKLRGIQRHCMGVSIFGLSTVSLSGRNSGYLKISDRTGHLQANRENNHSTWDNCTGKDQGDFKLLLGQTDSALLPYKGTLKLFPWALPCAGKRFQIRFGGQFLAPSNALT